MNKKVLMGRLQDLNRYKEDISGVYIEFLTERGTFDIQFDRNHSLKILSFIELMDGMDKNTRDKVISDINSQISNLIKKKNKVIELFDSKF